jgi:hypothetical protein
MLKNLIPKIFYDRLEDGLAFFVDALGFEVLYQDEDMAVIARDGAKAYLVESPEYAAKDRPELGIETDDVDSLFKEMASRAPQLLHPNSKTVAMKPWGSREFAMLDKTKVCVSFREWPAS